MDLTYGKLPKNSCQHTTEGETKNKKEKLLEKCDLDHILN